MESLCLYIKKYLNICRRNSLIIDNSKWIEKDKHYNIKIDEGWKHVTRKNKIDTQM